MGLQQTRTANTFRTGKITTENEQSLVRSDRSDIEACLRQAIVAQTQQLSLSWCMKRMERKDGYVQGPVHLTGSQIKISN